MPGVVVVLKVKVGYEMVAAEIVWEWGRGIVGSDSGKRCVHLVRIQFYLTLGNAERS